MVRMKDVAASAGVSVATVSNVFTGKHYVSPDVRARVMQAVEDLNYHINLNAQALKTSKTNTIGVILPDITKLFFNDVLRGILDTANREGYKITVLSSNYDYHVEKECISYLRGSNVDAIILDSCCDYRELSNWAYEIAAYEGRYTPVISLENSMNDDFVSAVTIDSYYWSNKITQYLISQGKSKILFISGPITLRHEHDRLVGYKQALKDNKIKINDSLIISRDFTSNSSYDVIKNVLKKGLKFDAIQASNDQAAIGATKALKEHNIKVPEDIMVCGFDNIFPSTLIDNGITTVSVPRYEIGKEAVKECIRHINDPSLPARRIVLNAEIIMRGSTETDYINSWDLFYW